MKAYSNLRRPSRPQIWTQFIEVWVDSTRVMKTTTNRNCEQPSQHLSLGKYILDSLYFKMCTVTLHSTISELHVLQHICKTLMIKKERTEQKSRGLWLPHPV